MRDDWFGHRRGTTGLPIGDREEWTDWDFALVNVVQTIEDYTMDSGILAWQHDDEAVEIGAVRVTDKFQASVDIATSGSERKPYKPQPGEKWKPDMWSRRKDGVIQTFREWVEKQSKEP